MWRKWSSLVRVGLVAVLGLLTIGGLGAGSASAADCSGSGNVFRYGNWECGTPNEYSPWAYMAEAEDYSFQRVTEGVRQGTYAARFDVRPGDDPNDTGGKSERAEAYGLSGTAQTEGSAVYYAFSTRYPSNWPQVDQGCCIVSQWRANNWETGWPPLMMNTPQGPEGNPADGMRLLQRSGLCYLPDSPQGQSCSHNVNHTLLGGEYFRDHLGEWHDWIIYVDWTATDNGRVKVWHRLQGEDRFTKRLDVSEVPTLKAVENEDGEYEVATVYSKFGLYRTEPQSVTHVLYNDSYCVAKWYAAAKTCLP